MLQPRRTFCLLALSCLTVLSGVQAKQCPQGWYSYGKSCYYFSQATADWTTARDICVTRGAILASVNSVDEMRFLTSQAKAMGNNRRFYVGVNDRASEGNFVNVDKSPFPGKPVWGPRQPDDSRKNEDCGSLTSINGFRLNDSPCRSSFSFICERGIDYKDPCDSGNGWHLISDKCYKYYKEPANWLEARQSCQDNDADLLVVNTNDELSLVTESVACDSTSSVWLGYSDTNDVKALQWVDGSTPPAAVMRWDKKDGEPDSSKYAKGSHCAASITLNKNLWELTNCEGNDMSYICEKDKGQCPDGWKSHKGTCYKAFNTPKTWPEAKKDCEGYGGAMASVAQAPTADVVQRLFGGLWVGISDRRAEGTFTDLEGNLVPTSQLAAQKPNKKIECGLYTTGVQLQSCYKKAFYTCFADLGAVKATPTSAPPDGLACQNEWTKYKKNCYKRVSEQKNYVAAKTDCTSQGGALVSIITQDEMDFLVADPLLLNTVAWIGFDNIKTQGNYTWVDGSPTIFTYWAIGEPNNLNKKENCAEVQSNGYSDPAIWNDVACNGARSYICKMKAQPGDQITTPIPTRPWSAECGQGWTVDHLSGNCYFFSLDQKNWQDSRKACQKMNSDLMSIESKYEQSFVQGMLRGDTSGAWTYWVGGNDLSAEQGWRWTDRKPFKYFNWNAGEPNSNGDEDCIEVVQQTGKWNDNGCSNKRNYICKRPGPKSLKAGDFATTPLPTITQGCKRVELISGDHWVPNSALSASSVRDKDSGPENSRVDWTAADKKVIVTTPNKYEYHPIANLNLKGVTSVAFTVQACNDAHISLQPAVENITRDAYEIVVGGWSNSQSVIRSEHQGASQVTYKKRDLLNCAKAMPFWISWDRGVIQVGKGFKVTGSTMFMKYDTKTSLTVSGMAVSTGWGANGTWVVTNPHGTRKGAWSPKYAVRKLPLGTEQFIYNQWIQVDFAKPTLITSVTIRGSASANEFITEFSLQYSYDTPYNFQKYIRPGTNNTRYFPGNTDKDTPKVSNIEMPFEAQYVRLYPRKFINYPSLRWALNGCPPPKYCDPERLVTGESSVPDWCIKTSSLSSGATYDSRMSSLPGKKAPQGWLAANPTATNNILSEEWIQIYLTRDMLIFGIVTKGHATQPYWVKSYQVQTKSPSGGFKFVNYQEPYGTIKTFTANSDQNTAVTNKFKNPVVASYVRIFPKEYNKMIGMRVDILGCLEGCSLTPMINGPNPISDSRLSASSSVSADLGPTKARLDTTGYASAWVAKNTKGNFFFQVDFGVAERIKAVSTQGRSDADQWVKQYSLTYSQDAKRFFKYRKNYRFPGNSDRNTKVKYFIKEIFARAIRIHPKSWKGAPAMRIELYGCTGSTFKYVGCYTEGNRADSFDGPSAVFPFNGPAKCTASCFKEGFMYAGLKRNVCKCASSLPMGGSSNRCNFKCKGNNKYFCGSYANGLVSVYETGIGPDDERCPSDYDTYNDKCFKVSKIKQSWQDARKFCQQDGGDLASIINWAEQSYIRSTMAKLDMGAWIGLNDLQEQMSFEWADGTPVKVTYWQHSEPNNWFGKKEDCVEAISFKEMGKGYIDQKLKSANGWWNDRVCEESRYSICQKRKERNSNPSTTPPTPAGCPFGWKAYQSSCYLLNEHRTKWGAASYTCKKEGGTLVRINDEFEQDFLTTELLRRTGYKFSSGATRYWTDLRENRFTNEYVWSNNWDVIPYTHWGKAQPPARKTIKKPAGKLNQTLINCVAMNGQNEPSTGFWTALSCADMAFPLCERPRGGFSQPPLPTLAPEDIPCPAGWVGVGPNCYQVNTVNQTIDMKNWMDAEEDCVKKGAHLAYINNATENDQLWRNYILQPGSDNNRYWIGLNDRDTNDGYQWISGDPFSYSNWKDGEPNDWDGLEPCTMLDGGDGLWNDEKCFIPMNWICSISRDKWKNIRNPRTTPEPTPGRPGSCPDGDDWKSFKGYCYYLNTDQLTFRDAETYCRSKGAHLVSIQSSLENSFVRAISKRLVTNFGARTASRANIGSVFTQVWTGLNELDRSKGHRWIDGSSYKFSNWAENEPNDYSGGEYCVGMLAANGEWNDVHCSIRIPSVCKKNPTQTGPITTTLPTLIDAFCPSGYMSFENNCYKIVVNTRLNWTSAKAVCDSENSTLASVMNSREQTFLTSQLNVAKKAQVALWLGLQHGSARQSSFFSHATSYVWSSNEDVGYTNWDHGEPNGRNKEACAEMLFNPPGRWNDVSCASERGSVCKKPKDGTITTAPPVDNSKCPSGYTFWQENCYKYISNKQTWNYMDGNICAGDKAHLLTIQDPYEYSFIRTLMWQQKITEDIWIGLMSQANSNSFTWSNGFPVVVTFWGKNEPANFATSQGCVLMNSGNGEDDGKWFHKGCSEMHSAICKIPLNDPPSPPPASGICRSAADETWVPSSDGYCYLFNVDPRYTFDEAEAACRSAGANLASLHSDTDTSFISTHMEFKDVVGGNGGTKNVWIGLRKLDSGSFQWTDFSAVYYANWAANEPNSVESNEKCTEVYSPNSEWNDVDCQSKRGFICKIKQGLTPSTFPTPLNEVTTTLPPTTKRTSPCPLDGWQFYKENCYLMVSQRNEWKRWNEASDYCKAPGREANLVSILSEDENQWIVDNVLPEGVYEEAWLGLAELQRDNRFRWIDGSPAPYVKWDDQQPDTNIGSMECVSMRIDGDASGRWSTRYCFTLKPFICKMDAKNKITPVVPTSVTDGTQCIFPFKYRGQEYNTCTTLGSSFLWCATSDHYERDGKFAVCDPFRCPEGWLRHEQLCYYFSSPVDKLSWTGAEQSCEDKGAELAYIGSSAVESFIADNINEFFWIGLNDRIREGSYGWDHRPNMVMVRGFTNWGLTEPRNIFGTEDCAQIVNGPYSDNRPGEWIMANCDLERRYICMQSATYTLSKTSKAPPTTVMSPTIAPPSNTANVPTAPPSKAPDGKSTSGGLVGVSSSYESNPSDNTSALRTGEITAIVIAGVAAVLAAVFIFLYIRRTRQPDPNSIALKSLGFENASYSRSGDTVQLANPGVTDS